MYESITSLFATSNNDLNAFLFLLSLSFVLGMLLWAIFIHYPQRAKLHKKHKEVLLNNQKLQKEARITNERFTVVNAKYDHLTNELQNLEARLKAKIQKNTEQEDTIVMITGQLELYKDHARNFKESKEKLTQEFQRILAENKKLNVKSDELSQIVNLSKQEKDTLQKEYNDRAKQFDKSEAQHNKLTQSIKQQQKSIQLLQKDLEEVQEQKSKFKKMVYKLEAAQPGNAALKTDFNTQIIKLKTHLAELEAKNADLIQKLSSFAELEKEKAKADHLEDALLEQVLVEAAEAMSCGAMYAFADQKELIEDEAYLQKTLGELKAVVPTESLEKPKLILTETETAEFAEAFRKASLALEAKGFYHPEEQQVLSPSNHQAALSQDSKPIKKTLATASSSAHITSDKLSETKAAVASNTKKSSVKTSKKKVDVVQLEAAILKEIDRGIIAANPHQKDDLKRIDGIGNFVEQQLNQYGIYQFKQISQFTPELMHKLGLLLGFSEETIRRDKWVEQAGILAN